MREFVNLWFLLTITQSIGRLQARLPYEVRWLGTSLDTVEATRDRNVIHCYLGTAKTIHKIWRTTEIHIFIKNEAFDLFVGANPDMVQSKYMSNGLINFDQPQRTLSLDPFNKTCLMVSTGDSYGVQLFITGIDRRCVMLMWAGVLTVFLSRTLSRNPAFFYVCASILGAFMLLILLLYIVTQRSVLKTGIMAPIIIGGWTTATFFFRQLWIVQMFDRYYIHCIVVTGFFSFLLAYRIGPPENPRTKNIMMWVIQGIGVVMIYSSSWHEEASAAIIGLSIVMTYLLQLLVKNRRRYHKVNGDAKGKDDELADKKQNVDSLA